MSDALNIVTPFGDVAALGQGYAQRADGDHLWLPMAQQLEQGAAVEFVILLADGTPAFAGSGQCMQVSDLGEDADPQVRFETAIGALQFDERSQPVYDYIVALHQAPAADAAADSDSDSDQAQADPNEAQAESASEFAEVGAGEAVTEPPGADVPEDGAAVVLEGVDDGEEPSVEGEIDSGMYVAEGEEQDDGPQSQPSMIPKGMLQRPAIAMHWKPAPPKSPQASASSGLFQYNGAGLPVPEEPPRPDLDPSLWVQPAPSPQSAASAPPPPPPPGEESSEVEALESTELEAFDEETGPADLEMQLAPEGTDELSDAPEGEGDATAEAEQAYAEEGEATSEQGAEAEAEAEYAPDEQAAVEQEAAPEAEPAAEDGTGEAAPDAEGESAEDAPREEW